MSLRYLLTPPSTVLVVGELGGNPSTCRVPLHWMRLSNLFQQNLARTIEAIATYGVSIREIDSRALARCFLRHGSRSGHQLRCFDLGG